MQSSRSIRILERSVGGEASPGVSQDRLIEEGVSGSPLGVLLFGFQVHGTLEGFGELWQKRCFFVDRRGGGVSSFRLGVISVEVLLEKVFSRGVIGRGGGIGVGDRETISVPVHFSRFLRMRGDSGERGENRDRRSITDDKEKTMK